MKEELTLKRKVKCNNEKCRYVWKTRSTMMTVTCPNCGNKTKVTP